MVGLGGEERRGVGLWVKWDRGLAENIIIIMLGVGCGACGQGGEHTVFC